MAHQGAKVIHPRAVEIAMQAQIPVRVRSTFSEAEGTLVTNPEGFNDIQAGGIVDRFVTGIAYVSNVTQISVECPDGNGTGVQLQIFKSMADNGISVDFINVTPTEALYTVFDDKSEKAISALQQLGLRPKSLSGCAKVSVIGEELTVCLVLWRASLRRLARKTFKFYNPQIRIQRYGCL